MPHWYEPHVADLETMMHRKGLSIKAACREAKIPASTFFRWKAGKEPRMSNLLKLQQAIEQYGVS